MTKSMPKRLLVLLNLYKIKNRNSKGIRDKGHVSKHSNTGTRKGNMKCGNLLLRDNIDSHKRVAFDTK